MAALRRSDCSFPIKPRCSRRTTFWWPLLVRVCCAACSSRSTRFSASQKPKHPRYSLNKPAKHGSAAGFLEDTGHAGKQERSTCKAAVTLGNSPHEKRAHAPLIRSHATVFEL